ncbi:MAG: trypsin-like peptidase domain-containing protein [Pirellulales bacterium]
MKRHGRIWMRYVQGVRWAGLAGLLAAWAWLATTGLALRAEDPPAAPPSGSPEPRQNGQTADVRQLAQRAVSATVGIYCRKDNYASFFGTGAVITPDGYVLTSTTVVPPGAEEIEVVFADFVIREGQIIESNEALETTLLKVDARDLAWLPLAADLPTVGSRAFTTSNANNVVRLSGRSSFSKGHISGLYEVRDQGGESLYAGLAIETTAAVNPGSDGGPILNEFGQLCGIISLNVSSSRWQGVGVPTKEILARLETFRSGKVKPAVERLSPQSLGDPTTAAFAGHAAQWSQWLVGLQVERKYPAEVLPRMPWDAFQKRLSDWKDKSTQYRTQVLGAYFEVARLLEVNQMLRRPPEPMTGIVVSPDGHILTSMFNVADEVVFLSKKTQQPVPIEFRGTVEELVKAPEGGFDSVPNPVKKIVIQLPNGSAREAQLIANHAPLGVALLKVDVTEPLPFVDLATVTEAPALGETVGLLGYVGGNGTRYTLNEGMVSAPSRNRGFHFQTDALLNYGNSGGPVLNASGKLLGIATSPIEPRTIQGRIFHGKELEGWAIAPNSGVGMIAWSPKIRDAFGDLKEGKSITKLAGPFLGISPDPSRVFGADVVIGQVGPQSPAEKVGLKRGDRILEVNEEEVSDWKDLTSHLEQYKPGDRVRIKIRRPGITRHLVIKGKKVTNEAELQQLLQSQESAGKFEGEFVFEDTKVIEVVLGERK